MGFTDTTDKEENQHTILVVDDDTLLLQMTRMILEALGYNVEIAATGAEALACFDRHAGGYSLVVLDQRLTDCNGIDVIRAARGRYPSLPFLMVTGLCTEEVIRTCLAAGAVGVVAKPYQLDEFEVAVKTAIGSSLGSAECGSDPSSYAVSDRAGSGAPTVS
ncbi:MAG: response regulator [Polyangiaceae bacterium]|nr:response regulator [Polyangiaceae bacterium]